MSADTVTEQQQQEEIEGKASEEASYCCSERQSQAQEAGRENCLGHKQECTVARFKDGEIGL